MEELVPNQIDCWGWKIPNWIDRVPLIFFKGETYSTSFFVASQTLLWSKLMTNGTEEGDRWEIGLGITKEKKASVALLEAVTDCLLQNSKIKP